MGPFRSENVSESGQEARALILTQMNAKESGLAETNCSMTRA